MDNAFGIVAIIIILSLAWVGFCLYFIYKALGFIINATRLYRSMIVREDSIISLLLDIRDNTKKTNIDAISALSQDPVLGVEGSISVSKVITGNADNAEYSEIVKRYQQIRQQYGESLSVDGIALKLGEELKADPAVIKAAIATHNKSQSWIGQAG